LHQSRDEPALTAANTSFSSIQNEKSSGEAAALFLRDVGRID
jgi:hypothetical protein